VSPARIRVRMNRDGSRSYQVVFRRGGRAYPVEVAGTFRGDGSRWGDTQARKQARTRRDLVGGWLAAGLDPRVELARIAAPAPVRPTFAVWAERYRASRVDLDEVTVFQIPTHLVRLNRTFAATDPFAHTPGDWQAWVAANADLKPSTIAKYLGTARLILDFAGVDPNPARDPAVRLPRSEYEEPEPPTMAHLLALLDRTPRRWRLPLIVMEQTGMTVGEVETLEWRDVDVAGGAFRLRRSEVKAHQRARARWVQLPDWLSDVVADTCPPDDRVPERRVFQGFNSSGARTTMTRACVAAGIPHYSPHDLRHRRLSLWHHQGVPARELAARAGHSRASMSLDVYSHVMPLDEAPIDRLLELVKP